ncbi:MAG TPA: hypothetical protein VGK34_07875 [Armatimonadota bacterium]|jgi:hypothetical protein
MSEGKWRTPYDLIYNSKITIWELLTIVLTLAVVAAVIFPLISKPHRDYDHAKYLCLSNVKRLGLAMAMYRQDHEGAFPNAGSWNGDLTTSFTKTHAFFCPETKNIRLPTYALNRNLAGTNEKNVTDPSLVVALFDSVPGKNLSGGPELLPSPPRHAEGDNYGLADGHAKWVKRGDAGKTVWTVKSE